MEGFITTLPTIGPYAIFVLILGYLAKLLLSSEKRHDTELRRVNAAHDDELGELRADIASLRKDIADLRKELGIERDLRRIAEEEAHRLKMLGKGED